MDLSLTFAFSEDWNLPKSKIQRPQNCKNGIFWTSTASKLISRNIWVTVKCRNFHTVVFYLLFMHICSEWKKIAAFANDLEHAYVLLCHPSRPPCDVIMFKSLEYTFLYTHYTVWKKLLENISWNQFTACRIVCKC